MLKRTACALAAFCILLTAIGCQPKPQKYEYQFFGAFDTVFILSGYADTQEKFDSFAFTFRDRTLYYHELFDIYNNYEGKNNIKTINDNAGKTPVEVPPELFELLDFCRQLYDRTDGMTNVMLGPVLQRWHDAREMSTDDPENAYVPDPAKLEALLPLCEMDNLSLDKAKQTAYLTETGCSLDVGAVAKGYAAELAVREASEISGVTSYLVSAGGNVLAGAAPLDGRANWSVGLQDPNANVFDSAAPNIDVLYVHDTSVVTSGDYQRYYTYDGQRLNHIIDPVTLWPATRYRFVTVIGPDSGVCDALSTAVFILPENEGRALVEKNGYNAVWMYADGTVTATDGIRPAMKNLGGATNKG